MDQLSEVTEDDLELLEELKRHKAEFAIAAHRPKGAEELRQALGQMSIFAALTLVQLQQERTRHHQEANAWLTRLGYLELDLEEARQQTGYWRRTVNRIYNLIGKVF